MREANNRQRVLIKRVFAVLLLCLLIAGVFYVGYIRRTGIESREKEALALAILVLCMLICASFYFLLKRNISQEDKQKLYQLSEQLKHGEALFRTIFEQSPIGVAIGNKDRYALDVNPMYELIVGRTKEELKHIHWKDFTHPEDRERDQKLMGEFIAGRSDGFSLNKRYLKPDGTVVWVKMTIVSLRWGDPEERNHACLIRDITEQVVAEEELRESERSKAFMLHHLPGLAYRCYHDSNWSMQFVSEGCFRLTGYKAESLLQNKEISFQEIIVPQYREIVRNIIQEALAENRPYRVEYPICTAAGEIKWVFEMGHGIYDEQLEMEVLEGLVIDITERKKKEEEIEYINYHDHLTGLYNRMYFEQILSKLDSAEQVPLVIVMYDINGIKLINDALGYAGGDVLIKEAAAILQSCAGAGDIVARTGGDEFSVILPQTDSVGCTKFMEKVEQACEEYNAQITNKAFYLHLSVGFKIKETADEDISNTMMMAEDNMYKRKLLEQKSSHSAIIASMKTAMFARSQDTEEHAERLVKLAKQLGRKLNLSQAELDELELLATLHDIGKIGIADDILNKPELLTAEERTIMEQHPEIGCRIAMSSAELMPIAHYILCHHEQWDGKGYPRGLQGEDIPLPSRILAVVDAYDAMTEDRLYRKALPQEMAIEELKNYAGIQFDPQLVDIFIEEVLKK